MQSDLCCRRAGYSIPNDPEDPKRSLGDAKICNCDIRFQHLKWGKQNTLNMQHVRGRGLIPIANADRGWTEIGVTVSRAPLPEETQEEETKEDSPPDWSYAGEEKMEEEEEMKDEEMEEEEELKDEEMEEEKTKEEEKKDESEEDESWGAWTAQEAVTVSRRDQPLMVPHDHTPVRNAVGPVLWHRLPLLLRPL